MVETFLHFGGIKFRGSKICAFLWFTKQL